MPLFHNSHVQHLTLLFYTHAGRALKQAIDCAQCSTFECFVDDADLDDTIQTRDELDNSVSEWIAELASCKRTGVQSNGIDLYMSAMCTPYGDGVELAVFLDDACTLYTTGESVYDVWDPNNDNVDGINYLTYAEGFIKSAFSEATSCLLQEFVDPNEIADEEEDAEEMYQMNDYCMAVLDGGVADFNNCEADVAAQEGELNDLIFFCKSLTQLAPHSYPQTCH
jgi:hypothetical protein